MSRVFDTTKTRILAGIFSPYYFYKVYFTICICSKLLPPAPFTFSSINFILDGTAEKCLADGSIEHNFAGTSTFFITSFFV